MANSVDPDQTAPKGAVCSGANSVDPNQTAPIGVLGPPCLLLYLIRL